MATKLGKPTQAFVPIQEVRDGYAILKDGSMRAILMTSSLNFALKSADEQNATLLQFQDMLNSLDFTIEIFIQSRKLDVRPYLALLEERYKAQVNDLMKIQTQEYIGFIKNFTESTNIMTKGFFIVVPYSPAIIEKNNPLNMLKREKPDVVKKKDEEQFEENRAQIEERIGVVEQGLVRCGIRVVQLGTEEIVELFYRLFNPGDTEKPIKVS
jgi:hypothetical protein